MPILFHDLNNFFKSVGCIAVANALRIMDDMMLVCYIVV